MKRIHLVIAQLKMPLIVGPRIYSLNSGRTLKISKLFTLTCVRTLIIIFSLRNKIQSSISNYKWGTVKYEQMDSDIEESRNEEIFNRTSRQAADISQVAEEVEIETALEIEVKTEPMDYTSADETPDDHMSVKQVTGHFGINRMEVNAASHNDVTLSNSSSESDSSTIHNFDHIWKEIPKQHNQMPQEQFKQQRENYQSNNDNCMNDQSSQNRKRIIRIMPDSLPQLKKMPPLSRRPYSMGQPTTHNSGVELNTSSGINVNSSLPTPNSFACMAPTGIRASAATSIILTSPTPSVNSITTTTSVEKSIPNTTTVLPLLTPISSLATKPSVNASTAMPTLPILAHNMPISLTHTIPEICQELFVIRKENQDLRNKVDMLVKERALIIQRLQLLERALSVGLASLNTF